MATKIHCNLGDSSLRGCWILIAYWYWQIFYKQVSFLSKVKSLVYLQRPHCRANDFVASTTENVLVLCYSWETSFEGIYVQELSFLIRQSKDGQHGGRLQSTKEVTVSWRLSLNTKWGEQSKWHGLATCQVIADWFASESGRTLREKVVSFKESCW